MAIKIWQDEPGIWADKESDERNVYGAAWPVTQEQVNHALGNARYLNCTPLTDRFGFLIDFQDRFDENYFWEMLFAAEENHA